MDMMARRRTMLQTTAAQSGGGVEIIAEGTFTGTGKHYVTIQLGDRCPETDFILLIWLNQEQVLPVNTTHKVAQVSILVSHEFVRYDLSTSGTISTAGQMCYPLESGASVTPSRPAVVGADVYNSGASFSEFQGQSAKVTRSATGFSISLNRGNSAYPFVVDATYHWRLIYYGADPANEIISI